jgi:hypothetical protein
MAIRKTFAPRVIVLEDRSVPAAAATFLADFHPGRHAAGDLDGDGTVDAVQVSAPGRAVTVMAFSGKGGDLIAETRVFEEGFTGGGFVAAGDLDGDGKAEVVVAPDQGGGARVQAFRFRPFEVTPAVVGFPKGELVQVDNFFAFADDGRYRGGARVAAGDFNGDGKADVAVGAGTGGGPRVAIFTGTGLTRMAAAPPRLMQDFFAFPEPSSITLRGGVYVGAIDLNGDGRSDLIAGAGEGGAPRVRVLSGEVLPQTHPTFAPVPPLADFFVGGDVATRQGVRVAGTRWDGDQPAVTAYPGEGGMPRLYLGKNLPRPVGQEPPDEPFAVIA